MHELSDFHNCATCAYSQPTPAAIQAQSSTSALQTPQSEQTTQSTYTLNELANFINAKAEHMRLNSLLNCTLHSGAFSPGLVHSVQVYCNGWCSDYCCNPQNFYRLNGFLPEDETEHTHPEHYGLISGKDFPVSF